MLGKIQSKNKHFIKNAVHFFETIPLGGNKLQS
jgi:hypothetical protein